MDLASIYAADPSSSDCHGSLTFGSSVVIIMISCALGIAWAIFNFLQVKKIDVEAPEGSSSQSLVNDITSEQRKLLVELGDKLANVRMRGDIGCR